MRSLDREGAPQAVVVPSDDAEIPPLTAVDNVFGLVTK